MVEPNHVADNSKSVLIKGSLEVQDGIWEGGADDYLNISDGIVTLYGTSKRILTLRPDLDIENVAAHGTPTTVDYGAFKGYSLPIWSTPANADEELYFSLNVPDRWDGESDVVIDIQAALSNDETVNDAFNLQLVWQHSKAGFGLTSKILSNVVIPITKETNIPIGRNPQYNTYMIQYALNWDENTPNVMESHDLLAMRLRRIAAVGTEITKEIIVLDAHCHFTVNKMFKAP